MMILLSFFVFSIGKEHCFQPENKYKSMAEDELKHAGFIHERALEEIGVLSKVYTPPAEMEEKWNALHKTYVEKAAWIRTMIAM